jgi:anthranilate synthase component 1
MVGIGSEVLDCPGYPYDALRALAADPPFSPVGYLGYEGGGRFLSWHDAVSIERNGITLFSRGMDEEAKSRIQMMAAVLLSRDLSLSPPPTGDLPTDSSTTMERPLFTDGVRQLKSHIVDGDCYQAVLSRKIQLPFTGDPLRIYSALRSQNPTCYGYFLDFGDEQVAGESPEMLVAASGSTLTTVPIAGTRPRGCNPDEAEALAADLLADKKERSEHLMLVDLARNDIVRVSAFGSVSIHRYAEVA